MNLEPHVLFFKSFCHRMNTNDVRSKNRREELIFQSIYPFFLPHQAQHSIAIRSEADKGSGSDAALDQIRLDFLKLVLNIGSNCHVKHPIHD
eukprot:scaffold22743_cov159-Skeletonema_dohrnii-CCMP3373.AAC.3